MGNGCNNQLQNLYQKSSFFPMLCRLSIKDVSISTYKDHSSSILDDPSSPKVSCIGQVKKNNRVNSFPSTNYKHSNNNSSADSTPTHHQQHHYMKITKLVNFFSSKNLIDGGNSIAASPSAIIKNCKSSRSKSCRSRSSSNNNREMMVVAGGKRVCRNVNSVCKNGVLEVNIDKLDPPLPVVKKVQQSGGGGDEVNLWQRRRFVAVKSLHIQQIHLPNDNCDPPTTV
ncbi:hypothetical protein Leryth_018958 [Lithospermum erythrorhizon]|nr:hypothetical protein Leryth_018958 [Lithospermum erythrorhizon]